MFPDERLPDWLHTSLCFAIAAPFALPLLYFGMHAIFTEYLEPLSGPDFGQYFFGRNALSGSNAQIAGCSLVIDGLAFFAISLSYTRFAEDRAFLRWLPYMLLALTIAVSLLVKK